MIVSGELQSLVEEGIRGVTANSFLLEKVIQGSPDYVDTLRASLANGLGPREAYELLLGEDIRAAADLLRPTYERTGGEDGYVCLDLNPLLAHEGERMAAEARRLFASFHRPNVMVKIPATPESLSAVEILIGEGIPVNVALIFSLETYEEAAFSFIRGLERRLQQGKDLRAVASVASFGLSPLDSALERLWQIHSRAGVKPAHSAPAPSSTGSVAITLARLVYVRFREIFEGDRFLSLQGKGAQVQRPLWVEVANQDPRYPETRYVEALIGPHTVMGLSPSALVSFRNQGAVASTLQRNREESQAVLDQSARLGIDLKTIGGRLQEEWIKARRASFEAALAQIAEQGASLRSNSRRRPSRSLGQLSLQVEGALKEMEHQKTIPRIWARDYQVWKPDPAEIVNRLGWLDLPQRMRGHLQDLEAFAQEVRGDGFKQVVLIGMGGSSLAPEVLRATFNFAGADLQLFVLDSTVPAWVDRITRSLEIPRTLFIASSKSGTTIEVRSLFQHFWSLAQEVKGERAGENFIAITDPGTPLEALAIGCGFRRTFLNHSDLGGRYSALSHFGLVPAALVGIDLGKWLDRAEAMAESCVPCVPLPDNPGAWLGAVLATSALQGKNKLTLIASPSIASYGLWIEQLIAESTGKEGKGIIPVVGEPLAGPSSYGPDRLFVFLRLEDDENSLLDEGLAALEKAGQPTVRLSLRDRYDLSAEFFRWEFATAVAGARLSIQPFYQPNVQESKANTERVLAEYGSSGKLAPLPPEGSLPALLSRAESGDYVALMAYLDQTPAIDLALNDLREAILKQHRLPTTLGYGPRFLHSTGQLHKGGPDLGLFIQLTAEVPRDLPILGQFYTFGTLAAAQALGDLQSLQAKKRRVIRIHLGQDVEKGLRDLIASVGGQARG
jgi:transaldolase/glucose-6-phosphate isomerase